MRCPILGCRVVEGSPEWGLGVLKALVGCPILGCRVVVGRPEWGFRGAEGFGVPQFGVQVGGGEPTGWG